MLPMGFFVKNDARLFRDFFDREFYEVPFRAITRVKRLIPVIVRISQFSNAQGLIGIQVQ